MVALLSGFGFEAKHIAFGLFVGLAASVAWTVIASALDRKE
jgi:F0F1-type ATP synthase membrane subunit b/b'